MLRVRGNPRKRPHNDANDSGRERLEEGKTVYYPNVADALNKPRHDGEWSMYSTQVERVDKRGEEQTFVVNETPFTKIGYNMVITVCVSCHNPSTSACLYAQR